MSFVHLHVHSEYSLLEAACKLKGIAKKAAELNMPAVALTDNGNMFGAIEFYFACKDKNVNPIIGCDFYLAPQGRLHKSQDRDAIAQPNRRLVLLAQNLQGYQNLTKLSSIGYQEGFYYKPRIDDEVLFSNASDLICLTGGMKGDVATIFFAQGPEVALERVRKLKEVFSDRLYLEINNQFLPDQERLNKFLIEASQITGVPLVAGNDVHYLNRDDQMAQEVLVCIGSNRTLQDESRPKLGSNHFYFKTPEEMQSLFAATPSALSNTLEIAERCQVKFKLKDESGKAIYHLPSFPTQEGMTLKDEIRRISFEGLIGRAEEAAIRNEAIPEAMLPEYHKRLDYELSVIDRMGFNGYFLIVQDFINWAKANSIPVGPGRGSGAGSLVAYCLKITDLDPLPHKLLFERFLNPERISMPDFDIDFCQDRRGEVINYVIQKYGVESVSQIITYGKLQARAAVKDVGRVLGMTFAEVDQVSKLIPEKLGVTLDDAIKDEPRMRELMEMNPTVGTLMDLARRVEGMVRHAGIHAAGVIIADGQLIKHAPLYKGADGENVVQYDMKHAEKIGLIKFDFLGLKTLTHIQNALNLIERNRKKKIRPQEIPLSDPGIYEIMAKGDTAGIFQFESEGITDAIRQIQPTSFSDITAINALYRPGPMDMIPEFAKRKHGIEPVTYLFDSLKEVLEETNGIIVYQEQVMAMGQVIAGYSLGEADMLRRAMGKKDPAEMVRHRDRFLRGAKEKGYDQTKANELFDLMEKFANYGFNKSHAAAYCVVAAQTAWLKNYYPAEFFAALLTTEMSDTDKIVKYSKDAQKRGIVVKSPHINYSFYEFNVIDDTIYFGLGGIKGVGESAVEAIIEGRNKMPTHKFETLEEFFQNVDLRRVNKKVIECLIKAGGFDGFGVHRAQLMTGFQKYLDQAEVKRKDEEVGQVSLFDMGEPSEQVVVLDKVKPWSRMASLSFEKEVLGFFLSDHPLAGYERIFDIWTSCKTNGLLEFNEKNKMEPMPMPPPKGIRQKDFGKKRVVLAGLLTAQRELITKKGSRMAFAQLEDLTGTVELVIFPDAFQRVEALVKDERPMLVAGLLEVENSSAKIMVDSLTPVEEALKKAKHLVFRLDKLGVDHFNQLHAVLKEHPGQATVTLEIFLPELKKTINMDTEEILVSPTHDFFENLHSAFGRTDFVELRS